MITCFFLFFFFKQKTAYEMRISDWSSDVCSSDLRLVGQGIEQRLHQSPIRVHSEQAEPEAAAELQDGAAVPSPAGCPVGRGEGEVDPLAHGEAIDALQQQGEAEAAFQLDDEDRKSTRLNSRH